MFSFFKMYFLQDFIFCFLNHPSYHLPLCCVDICWEILKAWDLFCFVIESVGGWTWIPFFSPWGSGCPSSLNPIFVLIHQATDGNSSLLIERNTKLCCHIK